MKVEVDYKPETIYIMGYNRIVIDGVSHLQYHSRFDEKHYSKCEDCRRDHLDFINEPEFQEDTVKEEAFDCE